MKPMLKKYGAYTSEMLLDDDFFVESHRRPTPESEAFWSELAAGDAQFAGEIATARTLLGVLSIPPGGITEGDKAQLWQRIGRANRTAGRRRLWTRAGIGLGAAAAVAVLVVFSFFTGKTVERGMDYSDMIAEMREEIADTENVKLILSDERNIDLEGKEAVVAYDAEGTLTAGDRRIGTNSASDQTEQIQYNRLIVPRSKRSQITLSDGSRMWVNSGSRVIYPVVFAGDKREIYVEGEVYLEVAKDASKPFVVKGLSLDVTVLGTILNYSSYTQGSGSVVLVEGSVRVDTPGERSDILSPGQMLDYGDNVSIRPVDVYEYIAWKDGFYIFRNETLSSILSRIEVYYGVQIDFDKTRAGNTCSGKLAFNEDISSVVATLNEVVPGAGIRVR